MPKMKRKRKGAVTGSTNTSVNVLLAEDVPQLGERGEIVRVKPGFARNYLLPQGLATVATEYNIQQVALHKQKLVEIQETRLKQIQALAKKVSDYSVTLDANANEEGNLYGSIVATDISKALKTAGYAVEPSHIKLQGPLKMTGMYTIDLHFHPDVQTTVKVWVVPSVKMSDKK